MTTKDISIVENSWSAIVKRKGDFGEIFYQRLFEKYPTVKPLFKTNMHSQSQKLYFTIELAVKNVKDLGNINNELESLGLRHVQYGAKLGHYDAVGDCLLFTLEEIFGKDWSMDIKYAWSNFYKEITTIMTSPLNG